tara:strand:- start:645 stop:1484 length:840 start_codon:yes stop_codon:yes gene_type:complete
MTGMAFRRSRDAVVVAGPDAEDYLQGQLSQEVVGLSEGRSAWSFVLAPSGKVDAWLRVSRRSADEFILDLDDGFAGKLVARLQRFMVRTRCEVEPLDWQMLTVVGIDPQAPEGGLAIPLDWPRLVAVDLLGPLVDPPSGLVISEKAEWERHRIMAGIPAMGAELDERTIPAATGVLDRSVSFTKGCYTGQELVARIDSRSAATPTRLVRVEGRLEGGTQLPPVGSNLELEDVQVGRLTSVAAADSGFVALAYVKRAVNLPSEALLSWAEGREIVALLAD